MGRGAVSSPLEFSRGAGELSLRCRAGGAPPRRSGSGALRAARGPQAPFSGVRPTAGGPPAGQPRARALVGGAASPPLSRARQPLCACQPCLWPCSPTSKRRGPIALGHLCGRGHRAARSFLTPRSSRGKEGGEGASEPWRSDWKAERGDSTQCDVAWMGDGNLGAKGGGGVGGDRGSRNRL